MIFRIFKNGKFFYCTCEFDSEKEERLADMLSYSASDSHFLYRTHVNLDQ
ncbi:hypothetical protein LEP1GSC188_0759 [Leptospira weilii serovar Topaz str. LT2116]|uniref:Uncharacterized protein n=1 Tax=Leptospira weilii serovar Topaz str. LT2116 TaxID=1088540 RepID=M3GZI7_9LEPT|nr:hypothetical protein LEP1GSC188_0759 [Leptospira weilii serovar Topaz str. LT2116]